MSTAGSVRSGEQSQYTPPTSGGSGGPPPKRAKTAVFRWKGIIPLVLGLALVYGVWAIVADRFVRVTLMEGGSKALGAQLDIEDLTIHTLSTGLELRGVALADPFDPNRNLFEVARVFIALEPEPLLQKKFVVKQLTIADVRTGTPRTVPARPVEGGGFAPRALAEVKRFAGQFKVPLLAMTPIDTLRSLVLDPSQLKTVQSALQLAGAVDSTRKAIEQGFGGLRVEETVDSSAALVARLQGTNVRTLGVAGARTAVADLRRAIARVDSAKNRVEGLVADSRRRVDQLQVGVAALDDAREEDYAFARGLLKLPSFDAPDIGAGLFGQVTIGKFEQAVYWATLARQYAPPGLLPRESPGPKRMRRDGATIHFVDRQSQPRFLLRRASVNVTMAGSGTGEAYSLAMSDVTTDPALVGRPTLFAVRRTARGGAVDSLRIVGSMNHLTDRPRDVVNAVAAGIALPKLPVPSLPFVIDPGRGASELRFVMDGNEISGRWSVRSAQLNWLPDSARQRALNTVETMVTRVLSGINDLELTADISGTLAAPRLTVRSNLDRQVADRLRAVVGEEVAAARQKAKAQVDKLVDERTAPVKAKVAELRTETDRRLTLARTRLDEEKRRLEERVKALGIATLVS